MSGPELNECNEVFQKLDEKFTRALQLDERGRLQNDAKLRAAKQNISYDDFRDIVNAAHLTPLEKADKMNAQKPRAVWNPLALTIKEKSEMTSQYPEIEAQSHEEVPKTGHEFLRSWKRFASSHPARFRLLSAVIRNGRPDAVLASDPCLDVLGEVVETLLRGLDDTLENAVVVARTLTATSGARRFGLAVRFLGSSERRNCGLLLEALRGRVTERTQDLADNDVTEWTLQELERKFELGQPAELGSA